MTNPNTIEDSVGTRQREAQRRRSRMYPTSAAPPSAAAPPEQGDFMRTEPYTPDRASNAVAQRGYHGEGAETTGNSIRGALSAGLSGATTTRGGQQGGIGASAYDAAPATVETGDQLDAEDRPERDLTLGEAYGGVMEQPSQA